MKPNDTTRMLDAYQAGSVTWEQVKEFVIQADGGPYKVLPEPPRDITSGEWFREVEDRYAVTDDSPLAMLRDAISKGIITLDQYGEVLDELLP